MVYSECPDKYQQHLQRETATTAGTSHILSNVNSFFHASFDLKKQGIFNLTFPLFNSILTFKIGIVHINVMI